MIADWMTVVSGLYEQVGEWAQMQRGWSVRLLPRPDASSDGFGDFEPSSLTLTTPDGEIRLEPLGCRSDGLYVVEMFAWPTLVRVRLLSTPGSQDWDIVTDSGLSFHWSWDSPTFARLVREMLAL